MVPSLFFIFLTAPYQPYNRHRIRYQERNRKRHRRKYRKQQQNQQNFRHRSGCDGTCRNMFSCMFSGKKVDWDNHGTCPGMMDTCCTKWDPSRRPKKYIKSGRSLGPFPQVQVTSIFVQKILLNKPNLWVRFGWLGSQVLKMGWVGLQGQKHRVKSGWIGWVYFGQTRPS